MKCLGAQVRDRQKTANLLEWHLSHCQNKALRRYLDEMLRVVLDHLEQAKTLPVKLANVMRQRVSYALGLTRRRAPSRLFSASGNLRKVPRD